jgi:hypothetical protein
MTRFASQSRLAPVSGRPPITHAGVGQEAFENALAAARQLLAGTVDTINPGTPAAELLACLERYRRHLAALVAASRPDTGQSSDVNRAGQEKRSAHGSYSGSHDK